MGKILKLNVNGEFEEIQTKGKEVKYDELHAALGGFFERVTLNRELEDAKINVFVDEEGKIKELPVTTVVLNGNNIVEALAGPLVFTGSKDPDTPSITDEQIAIVKEVINDVKYVYGHKVRIVQYN